jgi:hypothetical protein
LPAKKQSLKAKLKSWQLTATVILSISLIAGGVGVFAYQQYTQAQISAADIAQSAIEAGQERVEELTNRLADLELAIDNAMEIEALSKDKTLDEQAREELAAEIEQAKALWVDEKTKLVELEQALAKLRSLKSDGVWPEGTATLSRAVIDASKASWEQIVTQISNLGKSIGLVQDAEEAWQKEQDRIAAVKAQEAAEKAAAEAAAAEAAEAAAAAAERMAQSKTITPVSTITEEGGQTEPSAPAPPPPSQEIVTIPIDEGMSTRAFIEDYVRALAPNSFIRWVSGMCTGYYVCGLAWVGGEGSTNETPVRIELDSSPDVLPIYLNQVGISVLVHEAAHARQWFRYGSAIITESEKLTTTVQPSRRWPNGVSGKDAVEYMADCMTIYKLDYSTGVYTRSCTADQLEEARLTW